MRDAVFANAQPTGESLGLEGCHTQQDGLGDTLISLESKARYALNLSPDEIVGDDSLDDAVLAGLLDASTVTLLLRRSDPPVTLPPHLNPSETK